MIHFYSQYPASNPDTRRRQVIAEATWLSQPWTERPIRDEELPRQMPCKNKIPYIRDLFDVAVKERDPAEIIVFTNADICVRSDCAQAIVDHMEERDACYAFRRDFQRLMSPIPDGMIGQGFDYCGTDLFACRARWWLAHREQWPDLVLAREGWDACMRVLMEQTVPVKGLAIPNLIYHERHPNGWENPAIRYSMPSQLYNRLTAARWMITRGQQPHTFGL